MSVRDVLQLGHPGLRQRSRPVADPTAPEVARLARDLGDTLAEWRSRTGYGRAISAPQVGEPVRLVFVRVDGDWPLVNPERTAASGETFEVWDACLSSLEVFGIVRRHRWVEVRWQDLAGEEHRGQFDGDLSELLQHELDHLDGVLYLDRVEDVRTLCSRAEFEKRYRAESPYAVG